MLLDDIVVTVDEDRRRESDDLEVTNHLVIGIGARRVLDSKLVKELLALFGGIQT